MKRARAARPIGLGRKPSSPFSPFCAPAKASPPPVTSLHTVSFSLHPGTLCLSHRVPPSPPPRRHVRDDLRGVQLPGPLVRPGRRLRRQRLPLGRPPLPLEGHHPPLRPARGPPLRFCLVHRGGGLSDVDTRGSNIDCTHFGPVPVAYPAGGCCGSAMMFPMNPKGRVAPPPTPFPFRSQIQSRSDSSDSHPTETAGVFPPPRGVPVAECGAHGMPFRARCVPVWYQGPSLPGFTGSMFGTARYATPRVLYGCHGCHHGCHPSPRTSFECFFWQTTETLLFSFCIPPVSSSSKCHGCSSDEVLGSPFPKMISPYRFFPWESIMEHHCRLFIAFCEPLAFPFAKREGNGDPTGRRPSSTGRTPKEGTRP